MSDRYCCTPAIPTFIPTAFCSDSLAIPFSKLADSMAREDSCHGDSGDGEGGLFDRRAAAACGGLQARQPESASAVACGGAGWDEPGRCRADRWHGPPDAAGLGAPLQ